VTEPVNIGNADEVTIKEFAEEIIDLTGSDSTITYEPLPEDDPQVRQPDISRAREELGWTPNVDRRDGLQKTLDYFKAAVEKKQRREETGEDGDGASHVGMDDAGDGEAVSPAATSGS
jgi:dTDP-glucose 4,6-dehydratase